MSNSLRNRLIRLAQDQPAARTDVLRVLAADKAKTEEGAKKLFKKYLDGLADPSKSTKRPEDFFEKPAEDEKKDKGKDKDEKKDESKDEKKDEAKDDSSWEDIDPGDIKALKDQGDSTINRELDLARGGDLEDAFMHLDATARDWKRNSQDRSTFGPNQRRKWEERTKALHKVKKQLSQETGWKMQNGEVVKAASLRDSLIRLAFDLPEVRRPVLTLLGKYGDAA